MHSEWKTKSPCQPKREDHRKETIKRMIVSISSSTNMLMGEVWTEREGMLSSQKNARDQSRFPPNPVLLLTLWGVYPCLLETYLLHDSWATHPHQKSEPAIPWPVRKFSAYWTKLTMERTSWDCHVTNQGRNLGAIMCNKKSAQARESGSWEVCALPGLVTWRLSGSQAPYL